MLNILTIEDEKYPGPVKLSRSKIRYWIAKYSGVKMVKKWDRYGFYWRDKKSGDQYRILTHLGVMQIGDTDFDRWANSTSATVAVPTVMNEKVFVELLTTLRHNRTTFDERYDKSLSFLP